MILKVLIPAYFVTRVHIFFNWPLNFFCSTILFGRPFGWMARKFVKLSSLNRNVKTVSSFKHGYKITQPDWYLPPEGEWEWWCDGDVERTTVHRHFLRGPSGAIGSTTTRTRTRKSNGLIFSFVTGEQYGGWFRRPLRKAASAGTYASSSSVLVVWLLLITCKRRREKAWKEFEKYRPM